MPFDPLWLQTAGLVVLVALSGFFSMSETALVRVDRIAVRERLEADRRAVVLESLLAHPERILTTVLVGNNIVNVAAASLATVMAVQFFHSAGPAVATGAMTFLLLVFAEITPKSIAVRRALPISLVVALPLRITQILLWPVVHFFTWVARGLLRLLGVHAPDQHPFITQAQIERMVRVGVQEGEVERFEGRVISEVFDFTETPVREVMTPAERVRFVNKDARLQDALEISGRSGHSRIPVVDGGFDHVLGFVHAKDLLRFSDEQLREVPATEVLRAVLFARDDTPSDRVLLRMQREHKLMSIVQDNDGHNLGIATVEDLLEELVGEIHDEFDRASDTQAREARDHQLGPPTRPSDGPHGILSEE